MTGSTRARDCDSNIETRSALNNHAMILLGACERTSSVADLAPFAVKANTLQAPAPHHHGVRAADAGSARNRHQHLQLATPVAIPIDVDVSSIPTTGLPVRVRIGDSVDEEISWRSVQELLLVASDDCNLEAEPGIVLWKMDGSQVGSGYAGYDASTKTWWRYQDEATPKSYREHCMQILGLL